VIILFSQASAVLAFLFPEILIGYQKGEEIMKKKYKEWDDKKTPKTDKKAKIIEFRDTQKKDVVWIKGAQYRSATLQDSYFELVTQDSKVHTFVKAGKTRVEVVVGWFGATPKTSYPNIIIPSMDSKHFKFIPQWSGQVADNIGRKK
jgi:hypothetical protein